MFSTDKTLLRLSGLILAVTAAIAAGCNKIPNNTPRLYQEFGQDISDSLAAGRINGALELVNHDIAEALENNDSDVFYTALCKKGIVDYYMGEANRLLPVTDSVIRYMSRRPETPDRNFVIGKAYSARAGYYTRFVYEPDSNIHYYSKALDYLSRTGEPGVVSDALFNLGGAYKNNGRPDKGAEYFGRAIQVVDSAGLDDSYRIPLYSGLASSYTSLMDFDQSEKWWKKTGEFWNKMTIDDRFHYLNNRGNDLYMQKRYPESLRFFQRLDSMLVTNPELEWDRHFCLANLNDVYLRLGLADSVRRHIGETERYFTEIQPNPYVLEHIRTQRMQLAVLDKQYGDVERMFSEWQKSGVETRPEQKVERLEFLRDYYAGTGQWQKAYDAMMRHSEYEDSIRNHNLRLSASERQMRYERDSQVLALQKNLDLNKKLRNRGRWLVIGTVIVIILLVTIIIMMRKMGAAREERMLNRIIRLRVKAVRSRITPHFIYNILNHETTARQKGEKSEMEALVRVLRQQQYMVDEFSVTLSEDIKFIDDFIRLECGTQNAPVMYEKNIDPDIDLETVRVPSMIVQIFVENAYKHGFSSLAPDEERILKIHIGRRDGRIEIEVMNNAGHHSHDGSHSTHLGLRIVAETLQILNEKKSSQITFSIAHWTDNPQQKGCRAILSVPDGFNFDINR